MQYKYCPLYTFEQEYRYSAYLDFCARSFCGIAGGYIKRKQFTDSMQKAGFERKTAIMIWVKGAIKCEYFRGVFNDTLYFRKKEGRVIVQIPSNISQLVKSISQFKIFVTALQAGKLNEYGNRSRTLSTIGSKTGTAYKQTVSQRIKKAKKLGLSVAHRFIKVGDNTAQISNSYEFSAIKYIANVFSPTSISKAERRSVKKYKNNMPVLTIVEQGKMIDPSFYETYSSYLTSLFNYA